MTETEHPVSRLARLMLERAVDGMSNGEVWDWYLRNREAQRDRAATRPSKWRPRYRLLHESSRAGPCDIGMNARKRLRLPGESVSAWKRRTWQWKPEPKKAGEPRKCSKVMEPWASVRRAAELWVDTDEPGAKAATMDAFLEAKRDARRERNAAKRERRARR